MKKFIHFLGAAILALSMTSCDPNSGWNQNGENGEQGSGSGSGNGGGGATDPTAVSGTINTNTTWPDLGLPVDYVVSGNLYVSGNALLTIEPGVTIMFDGNDGSMHVGENAGISMVGTIDKPIVFTGPTNNPNNGSWEYIEIKSTRNDNRLEYVQFIRGGSQDYSDWRSVVHIGGKVHMNNCLIDGSLSSGLYVNGSFYSFSNNTIKNCEKYPLFVDSNESLYSLDGSNSFINNGKNYVIVEFGSVSLSDHVVLKRMSVPYYFIDGYAIYNQPYKYTIEPGTIMLFGGNTKFEIGEQVTFIAEGTADAPIIIRGLEDEPAYWRGITYKSNKISSKMNYCHISGSGYDDSYWANMCNLFIYDGSRLTLTNCIISNSMYYGIGLDRPDCMNQVTHSNNTFLNNYAGNVWIESGGEYNGVTYTKDQILSQLP